MYGFSIRRPGRRLHLIPPTLPKRPLHLYETQWQRAPREGFEQEGVGAYTTAGELLGPGPALVKEQWSRFRVGKDLGRLAGAQPVEASEKDGERIGRRCGASRISARLLFSCSSAWVRSSKADSASLKSPCRARLSRRSAAWNAAVSPKFATDPFNP